MDFRAAHFLRPQAAETNLLLQALGLLRRIRCPPKNRRGLIFLVTPKPPLIGPDLRAGCAGRSLTGAADRLAPRLCGEGLRERLGVAENMEEMKLCFLAGEATARRRARKLSLTSATTSRSPLPATRRSGASRLSVKARKGPRDYGVADSFDSLKIADVHQRSPIKPTDPNTGIVQMWANAPSQDRYCWV
jgi:hypothetical protein